MYLDPSQTNRLHIRKLNASDKASWESFFIGNPNLDYLGLEAHRDPPAQARDWIERQLERYEQNRFGHMALIEKSSGAFIGQAGLLTQEIQGKTEIEIGYHILPKYWGKGFATEAARAFRNFAFKNAISPSLISVIDIRNTASRNVAGKIGMQPTETLNLFNLEVLIYRVHAKDLSHRGKHSNINSNE